MRSLGSLLLSTLAVLATHSQPLVAEVFTVGPAGSGADFADIQLAIDAAQTGDTVLVAAGTYAPFTLDKGLRVIGAGSASGLAEHPPSTMVKAPFVSGVDSIAIEIRDLPEGADAWICGLEAWGYFDNGDLANKTARSAIEISNCVGRVYVHGVWSRVALPDFAARDDAAIGIRDSSIIQVSESRFEGGWPSLRMERTEVWINASTVLGSGDNTAKPGAGCQLSDSSLFLSRTSMRGGKGDAARSFFGYANPGAPAISASNSLLKLVGGPGAELVGGEGGLAWSIPSTVFLAKGGPGLVLSESSVALTAADMQVAPGWSHGLQPPPAVVTTGASIVYDVSTTYPTFRWSSTKVAPAGTIALDIGGNPASPGLFAIGLLPAQVAGIPGIDGATILPLSAPLTVFAYQTGSTGAAARTFQVPALTELVGLVPFVQGLEIGPVQNAFSNPAFIVIR